MRFMPPQHYLISTLAEILSGDENGEAQRERVRQLSQREFGRMVVLPRVLRLGDGRLVMVYEGDELVDGPVGARHRSTIKPGPGGVRFVTPCLGCRSLTTGGMTGSSEDKPAKQLRVLQERFCDFKGQVVR